MLKEPENRHRVGTSAVSIAGDLRQDIVAGRLAAGSRLPTRTAIEESYRASPMTVQRALDLLIGEGFAVSKGRNGTFVSQFPPNRHRWALIFPERQGRSGWNRFFAGLLRERNRLAGHPNESIDPRHLVMAESERWATDHQQLVDDLQTGRLAGFLYTVPLALCAPPHSPLHELRCPRVWLAGNPQAACAHESVVNLGSDWLAKAIDQLHLVNRRRLAYIGSGLMAKRLVTDATLLAGKSLALNRNWVFTIPADREAVPLARDIARLLFDRPAGERPDGLIIGDDNLTESVLAGIADAGLSTPRDLTVVAYVNHPEPGRTPMICVQLGYDLRELLATGVSLLAACRDRGERTSTMLAPVIVSDLERTARTR